MKVMENLETEEQLREVEAVLYILNVTSRIKDYAFQINRLLQTEVKRRNIQVKKQKKIYIFANIPEVHRPPYNFICIRKHPS